MSVNATRLGKIRYRYLGALGVAAFSWLSAPPLLAQTQTQTPTQVQTQLPAIGPIEAHLRSLQAKFDSLEPTYRAWISTDWDTALQTAQAQDRAKANVATPPSVVSAPSTTKSPATSANQEDLLLGMVIGVKDNIDVEGFATTAGSKSLRSNRPNADATVVSRLRKRGVIFAGKTNLDTFARGVRSLSEVRGQTANAWDANRSAGGSSGGSAVAVATEMVDAALGTDTCGSLRYPATYNGIYSLRPTKGSLSRHGVVPLSPSQDTVGPMARTPTILRALFEAMLGIDPLDPMTSTTSTSRKSSLRSSRFRVGIVASLGTYARDASGRSMLDLLGEANIELVPVNVPKGVRNASLIEAEGDVAIASYRKWIKEDFATGNEVPPWLEPSWRPATTHWNAVRTQQQRNALLLTELLDVQRLDAIAYPTTPFTPAMLGQRQPSANCWLSATSGLPALAVPGGFNDQHFPVVGVDLLGRAFDEATLLNIAETVNVGR
jgi:amidase